ncbi:MAG: TraR/DksA C4-type zinc finger protein [Ginsengibacter sp.]
MATKNKKATSVAKKPKAAKSINKKTAVKKVAAPKKAASKKPSINTKVKKVAPLKKAASKLSKTHKTANTIKKQSPVKKAAKSGVKKAAPKKLSIPKKNTTKNIPASAKKAATQKEKTVVKKTTPVKKPVASKPIKQKPAEKVPNKATPKPLTDHNAELKKALAKVKAKNKVEEKKVQKVFVMPKTHTEKARKYEPEFIKSVLDQSPVENSGPSMRYSDNELIEFRELITRKLETAKKELGYLQGLITRKDQMGGDESDNRYMTMEDGSLSMEREQLSQMASRQITFIDHLEKAMMRIENKTYGICRVTGKLIDKARLRAVPHATLSIEAKMGIAK